MNGERVLREKRRLQQQRRLAREAYQPIWQRIRRQTPVVFALQGTLHSFRLELSQEAALERLRKQGAVFALETAARLRWRCQLLNSDDVFAYVVDLQGIEIGTRDEARPGLEPFGRAPHAFLVQIPELPPFDTQPDGSRFVQPDRLIMEYVGLVGHRFDLLAALCARIDAARADCP